MKTATAKEEDLKNWDNPKHENELKSEDDLHIHGMFMALAVFSLAIFFKPNFIFGPFCIVYLI